MNIVVIGNDIAQAECKAKFGNSHQYITLEQWPTALGMLDQAGVVLDFSQDGNGARLASYVNVHNIPIFINTIFTTLTDVVALGLAPSFVFGFCGLPTFFNRNFLEITVTHSSDKELLKRILGELNTEYKIVNDQVGMVSPRVIAMIINEANEALQQGVASREDIDLSMKLGTNYPFGPFEWAEKIGTENVRRLLNALEKSTGDKRYHPTF